MRFDELKCIRKSQRLSRKDLSILSGVHFQTIYDLEKGNVVVENVKLSTLIKLAKALKTKVRKILPKELTKNI